MNHRARMEGVEAPKPLILEPSTRCSRATQNERVFGVLRRMALWKNFFYHTLGAKSREVGLPVCMVLLRPDLKSKKLRLAPARPRSSARTPSLRAGQLGLGASVTACPDCALPRSRLVVTGSIGVPRNSPVLAREESNRIANHRTRS